MIGSFPVVCLFVPWLLAVGCGEWLVGCCGWLVWGSCMGCVCSFGVCLSFFVYMVVYGFMYMVCVCVLHNNNHVKNDNNDNDNNTKRCIEVTAAKGSTYIVEHSLYTNTKMEVDIYILLIIMFTMVRLGLFL